MEVWCWGEDSAWWLGIGLWNLRYQGPIVGRVLGKVHRTTVKGSGVTWCAPGVLARCEGIAWFTTIRLMAGV